MRDRGGLARFGLVALWTLAALVLLAAFASVLVSASLSDQVEQYYLEQTNEAGDSILPADPVRDREIQILGQLQWTVFQLAGPLLFSGVIVVMGALAVHAYRWDRRPHLASAAPHRGAWRA